MASIEDSVIALKNAVRNGDKELVVKLLDQGVDPNQFGSSGYEASSPLMVACVNRHLDLIRLLISRGAEVDLKNKSKAMEESSKLEVLRILLEHS